MANDTGITGTQDPSANVLLLVEGTVKRLEDLLAASERNLDKRFDLFDKMIAAEIAHIKEMREIDVVAVGAANDRAAKAAELLAKSVTENAETLRTSVTKIAETLAASSALTTSAQNERIAALEKIQNENIGRSGASFNLIDRVVTLENSTSETKGVVTGSAMTKAEFRNTLGVFVAIIAILGFALTYLFKR